MVRLYLRQSKDSNQNGDHNTHLTRESSILAGINNLSYFIGMLLEDIIMVRYSSFAVVLEAESSTQRFLQEPEPLFGRRIHDRHISYQVARVGVASILRESSL